MHCKKKKKKKQPKKKLQEKKSGKQQSCERSTRDYVTPFVFFFLDTTGKPRWVEYSDALYSSKRIVTSQQCFSIIFLLRPPMKKKITLRHNYT